MKSGICIVRIDTLKGWPVPAVRSSIVSPSWHRHNRSAVPSADRRDLPESDEHENCPEEADSGGPLCLYGSRPPFLAIFR
jgi:hypothetical protein